jgi:hypothetical protein
MSIRSDAQKFDELIDIMAGVPVLLEESDMLINGTLVSVENIDFLRGNILRSYLLVVKKLSNWQLEVRADHPSQFYWAVPSSLDNPADVKFESKLVPFALEFDSLDTAVMFCLSWGVMLQLLMDVMSLYSYFFGNMANPPSLAEVLMETQKGPKFSKESLETYLFPGLEQLSIESVRQKADQLSRHLCQTVEFFHRIDMGTLGSQSTCYMQWIVRKYFRSHAGNERELEWVMNIKNMEGPGFRFGIELMTFRD